MNKKAVKGMVGIGIILLIGILLFVSASPTTYPALPNMPVGQMSQNNVDGLNVTWKHLNTSTATKQEFILDVAQLQGHTSTRTISPLLYLSDTNFNVSSLNASNLNITAYAYSSSYQYFYNCTLLSDGTNVTVPYADVGLCNAYYPRIVWQKLVYDPTSIGSEPISDSMFKQPIEMQHENGDLTKVANITLNQMIVPAYSNNLGSHKYFKITIKIPTQNRQILNYTGTFSININGTNYWDKTHSSWWTSLSPADNTITLDKTPSFTFTAVSNVSTSLSCNLLINNTGYGLNSSTLNNTATTIIANSTLTDGLYNWDINCSDAEGSYASSLYNLTITALGTGTLSDPYQITSWEQLQAINGVLSSYFILMNDLNSTTVGFDTYASINANGGAGWVPIGDGTTIFTGSFDGQGHLIADLYISGTANYQGLFGDIGSGGVIKNIGVNGSVSGSSYVGGLVGNNVGTITNSYSTGSVSGDNYIGGLAGYNYGTITNSYSTGSVSGNHVGGLVGINYGTITNSYSTGSVSGSFVGGLVGIDSYGTYNDDFWDTQTSGQTTSAGGTGKTTIEMQTLSTFTNWNITSVTQKADGYADYSYIWNIVDGSTYPFESWEYPDTTAPVLILTSPANITYSTTSIDLNYSSSDTNLDTTWYKYNGTNTTLNGNTTFTALDNQVSTLTLYANDSSGNINSTNVTFTVDTTPPVITIISPTAITYATNESLNLNYTSIDSDIGTDICLYNLANSSGNIIIANTSLVSCSNTTFNISQGEGTYNLTLYSNDTLGNMGSTNVVFSVSLNSPAINLYHPTDNEYLNYTNNIKFNFTATDSNGIAGCQLWSNWTGNWSKMYVWNNITSGVENSTIFNLADVHSIWNIWCNNSIGNAGFSLSNYTFTIDTTPPNIAIPNPITTTPGSQTISFNTTEIDTNLNSCKYSIYNSTGVIDGINDNISFTCNSQTSATVTGYGTYTLKIYASDLASNENSINKTFTTSASTTTSGGGGSSTPVTYPTVGIIQPKNITTPYSELDKTLIFSEINNFCRKKIGKKPLSVVIYTSICTLNQEELLTINKNINNLGFSVPITQMPFWYNQYINNKIYQTFSTKQELNKYNLETAIIIHIFRVNPPNLNSIFILPKSHILTYTFKGNKPIESCDVLSKSSIKVNGTNINPLSCILSSNTTVEIRYIVNNPSFRQLYTGEISITSKDKETRYINLYMSTYDFNYSLFDGFPIWGIILILFSLLVLVFILLKKEKLNINKFLQ